MKKIVIALMVTLSLALPINSVLASDYNYYYVVDVEAYYQYDHQTITHLLVFNYDSSVTQRINGMVEYMDGTTDTFYFGNGSDLDIEDGRVKYFYFNVPSMEDINFFRIQARNGSSALFTLYNHDLQEFNGEIDIDPPDEVTNLEANATGQEITLNWMNPTNEDFSHVNIYRNNTLLEEGVIASTFVDNNVIEGNTYTYSVATVDESGNESEGVNVQSKLFIDSDGDGIPDDEDEYPDDPDNVPPPETAEEVPEVEDLQIEATPERVDLSWKNPPRYFEKATIYRKTTGTQTSFNMNDINPFAPMTVHASEDYQPLFETNGTTFADLSVNESEEYQYKVTNTFNGLESDGVTVQTTIPKPPLFNPDNVQSPFTPGDIIASSSSLLNFIGAFLLLGIAFLILPKLINLIKRPNKMKVNEREGRRQKRAIRGRV